MLRRPSSWGARLAGAFTLGAAISAYAATPPPPEAPSGWSEKNLHVASRLMVASANPHATAAGVEILKRGGTAMDAAVAVQLVLNLTEPQSSGIGGGAFLLYWDAASRELHTIDGREVAPARATENRFLDFDGEPIDFFDAVVGGQSVGVPGTLRALELGHQLFGRRSWAELFEPAIALAKEGFAVSPRLATAIAGARALDRFRSTREYFFDASGKPLAAGTLLSNAPFARTLREIATNGSRAFYEGRIATDIVSAINASSTHTHNVSLQDLREYRVKLRRPVCLPYRGTEVCGMGPPTSGGLTVGQILGILRHFEIKGPEWTLELVHLYAQAAKLAYADRSRYMADSDFVPVPARGLLAPSYLRSRAALVDLERAGPKATPGNPPRQWHSAFANDPHEEAAGTSHFTIVDSEGNAISMTTTIETGFGSRVMVRGFLLNNELTDFSFQPKRDGLPVANRLEPGKRPRSSMSPTMVFRDGKPYLLIGSPGGSRIINYVAQSLVSILDLGMDPQTAINQGHIAHRNRELLELEENSAMAALEPALKALGHQVKLAPLNSGLHAILIREGALYGAADPRREGLVSGE